MLPCVIFEDEHLLAVNKPAGMNTHAPSPYAGEGIYDWLRHRERRRATLAIIHRLDKETSGVLVFSKTALANRSLTEQFTRREVRKQYHLLASNPLSKRELIVKSKIARAGERYFSSPRGEPAETRFQSLDLSRIRNPQSAIRNRNWLLAEPLTGRTHQIRVHAAESGFPVLGDTLYGGARFPRLCLHAAQLTLRHPATHEEMTFRAPVDFDADPRFALRESLIESNETNAFRLIHGASDGWSGWYVERLGDFLLSHSEQPLTTKQRDELERLRRLFQLRGAYHKALTRQVRRTSVKEASPQLVLGEAAPERFDIRENGLQFEVSFAEGYSTGLFLDQRDNRRRVLTGHIASGFSLWLQPGDKTHCVLNTFAYTCGFSVCAARAGAHVTSLDLSKKYLEWGSRNFALNGMDAANHDFIFGDVFDWLRRLAKKGRVFDLVLLDPPTFSQSKEHGAFRVEKDYGKLVAAALRVLAPNGVLFASANATSWAPERFLATVEDAAREARRKIVARHYVPQPPDFPISRGEPAYLKTVWMRV